MSERIVIATADDQAYGQLQEMLGEVAADAFAEDRCCSLSETVASMHRGAMDALLLDLDLPGSQGLETLQQLRGMDPMLPIILICSQAQQTLARQALGQSVQGYIFKGDGVGYLLAQMLHDSIGQGLLKLELQRAQVSLDSIDDAVIGMDMRGGVDYINSAAEVMTGWLREEAVGQPITRVMRLVEGTHDDASPLDLAQQERGAKGARCKASMVRRDGALMEIEESVAPIHGGHGRISGAVVVFQDVTEARRMSYLAQHDVLTRLPNRVLLNDRIAQAIGMAQRNGNSTALLFLDLDNFKRINDSLGHAGGDQLLREVAQRLSDCVRGSDTVSRNGGDEFVVLLAEERSLQDAGIAAQKILAALAEPHRIDQQEVQVTTSIGISVYPADAKDADTLMKNADTAMYCAKQAGRNNFQFFRRDMNLQALERQRIERDLSLAQPRHQLCLHYQPRVDLATGAITGAEALLRWRHPTRGLLLPECFLKQAEDSGLIVPIGRWALQEACLQFRRWRVLGSRLASVTVKLSSAELYQPDFVSFLRAILKQTGLSPCSLQLDIREASLTQDIESSSIILQQLSALGVRLALVDFGLGLSNLHGLLAMPFDVLKINRASVQAMGCRGGQEAIAGALIALGERLGCQMVATGVETSEQSALLQLERCNQATGFLFGHGMPARQFTRLLNARTIATAGV